MKKLLKSLMVTLLMGFAHNVVGQSIVGHWESVDDQTGQAKAIVNVYEKDGRLFGRIEDILVAGEEGALCSACSGKLADKPIKGMQIINGLEREGPNTWKGGSDSLFDPEQGKSFRSKIWLDPDKPDKLYVRGYWMFFHRTQIWNRVKNPS